MYMGLVGIFILWVFFLYGVFEFIRKIIFDLKSAKDKKANPKPVLVVKEQGESIESILRILHSNGIEVEILTLPSNDDTSQIVERLAEDLSITKIGEG